MTRRYEGKIVLVTGSAGGLGRDFAQGFAAEGATLILADMNEAGLAETAGILKGLGAESSTHRVDLSIESEIHAFAAEVKAAYPRVDVLINNAGLAYGKISRGFADLTQADWLFFFSVNTIAPLLLAEALRDHLAVSPGNIINQSSMASYVPGTAYGITKAALNAMSFGMAASFAQQGIRVNSIQPGIMDTPNSVQGVDPDNYARIQAMQMLKLHGGADDITRLALFIASDDARFITNEFFSCDAGHPFRGFRV